MKNNYNYKLESGEMNPLNLKEVEVIHLLCNGENISSISKKLFKSKETINNHISLAKKKLEAKSRDQLIAIAITNGFVNV
ncbi:MAG: response regulator transcription factor [Alteromonadales bacterium]|nr:response regulator transcription factor [Alteromonadales bacterium]